MQPWTGSDFSGQFRLPFLLESPRFSSHSHYFIETYRTIPGNASSVQCYWCPAVTAFIGSYRILVWYKRTDDEDLLFRYFLCGISLMSVGIIAALLIAVSDKW